MSENTNISTRQHVQENPFPGLRPFGIKESHIYFGREGQSDEVLNILCSKRFAAILGSSGTGKSSLMFSGVIPTLHGGYYTEGGRSWEVISARPGLNPLDNLSDSFCHFYLKHTGDYSKEEYIKAYFRSVIRRSSKGLINLYKSIDALQGKNLLIYLDQFEEIFRFVQNSKQEQAEQSIAYVNLILESIKASDTPIFIASSMRSDFLGECEQFPELTNRINESHYLIPQMTRDQKRLVIEGPISVGKGSVSNRLVQRLLNDMGDRPDQLPVLQHSLMRTWDYWTKNRKGEEPIDFLHYEAIGTVNEALSRHADEAFLELDSEQQKICERIFKTITEKRGQEDGIRRPTKLNEIARIADVEQKILIPIINKFREQGRALLMPPPEFELGEDSIIDISHEALMRVWYRLRDWVDEESASSAMYFKLSEAARNYQKGIGALWRPPDLQLAIEWRNKTQPTLSWAMQYDPNFEAAIAFLNKSEDAYNAELENKERIQKERLRKSRLIASFLGSAAIVSVIMLFFAYNQKNIADKQKEIAIEEERRAIENADDAERNRILAELGKRDANLSNQQALNQRRRAEQNAIEATLAGGEAERQKIIALRETQLAKEATINAERQADSAMVQRRRAEESERRANMLLMQSTAKNLALKSQQQDEVQLKALLAYFAYKFNTENEGYKYDNDVYNALFNSLLTLNPPYFEAFRSELENVVSTELAGSSYLFSSDDKGKVYEWKITEENPRPRLLFSSDQYFRKIATNYLGSVVVGLDASSQLYIYDRTENQIITEKLPSNYVYDVSIVEENEFIISGSDSYLYKYKNGLLSPIVKTDRRVFSLAYVADKNIIITGTESGKVQLWNNSNGKLIANLFDNPSFVITSLALSDRENKIAIGDNLGNIRILMLDKDLMLQEQFQLVGHDNRIIKDLSFNDKLNQLISASTDGTVRIWNLNDPDQFPIIIDEAQSWIESIAVDYENSLIYAALREKIFRVYPLFSEQMAKNLLELINRDLSQEEWRRFIGQDIEYQSIMKHKAAGNK